MKKISLSLMLVLTIFLFVACSGNNVSTPKVKISDRVTFDKIDFKFSELIYSTKIKYHSAKELETMINSGIRNELKKKSLLSQDKSMNNLKIDVSYQRRFVGDETPIPTNSLAGPRFEYTVTVFDKEKVLTTVKKLNQIFSGGFTMNLKIMAGQLRDKKYEKEFVTALVKSIVKDIENLK